VAGRYNLNVFPGDARFPRERQTIATHSVDLTAAGGVVLRRPAGAPPEVVVCGRSAASLWALPKGKPNAGEPPEATARREVQEETGLEVDVGPLVGEVTYSFHRPSDGALCNKVVRFFLMSPKGGDLASHDGEFDQVLWLPAEDAKTLLTYENEARILEKALAMAKDPGA
jgi:8-oxo-dGTP diphosphatase